MEARLRARDRTRTGRLREMAPAVDIAEKDKAYEITAELPGLDPNNIELKFSNGTVMIKGEKNQDSERRHGAFERSFQVPQMLTRQRSRRPSPRAC
jgi:HSP20 family molecular chaperone IbpA